MPGSSASISRSGEALVFAGALLRDQVASLWPQAARGLEGVRRIDLAAVERIDSAGLALLVELVARAGTAPAIDGAPDGLSELRAAYRLTPRLAFASA